MISAVVLTKNEEDNIKDCLSSLKWCEEIVVVDDCSTDATVKLARDMGAKIYERPLDGDFAEQRNFSLRQAQGDWVLFIDADERVSPKLTSEIQKVTRNKALALSGISGFYFKRIDYFMGKWLKHGEIGGIWEIGGLGGVRVLRLAKKGSGKWVRCVDEKWKAEGMTKTFKNPLLHYPHPSLTEFLQSINERSTLNAKAFYLERKKITLLDWFKPLGKFCFNYFLKLGFLDGISGFVLAILMSLHSFLVRGKLYLMWRKEGGWR